MFKTSVNFLIWICLLVLIEEIRNSSAIHFEPQKVYKYSYDAEVILNEADLPTEFKAYIKHADVGVKVAANIEFMARWTNPNNPQDQVIEIQYDGAEIFNVSDRERRDPSFYVTRKSKALRTINKPTIFRMTDGMVTEFYVNSEETVTSLNIKRGMLGMMQIMTKEGTRSEIDPRGTCNVKYEVHGNEVKKIRELNSCKNNEEGFTSANKVLGVSSDANSRALYTLSENGEYIMYAVALETNSIRVNVKQEISLYILGRQKLGLLSLDYSKDQTSQSKDEALQGFAKHRKALGEKYIRDDLGSQRDVKDCVEGCLNVINIIDNMHHDLTKVNMANVSSAQAYIAVVRAARQADQETLGKLLKEKKYKNIQLTLVDIYTAAQTTAAHKALMDFLNFGAKEDSSIIERALTGFAFSSHPSEELLGDLMSKLKGKIGNNNVRETTALAVGAVLNKVCKSNLDKCDNEIAKSVRNFIHQGLMESSSEEAQNFYLLFARNSALPEFIPLILKLAEHSEYPLVNHHALTTLNVFQTSDLNEDFRIVMRRIYHQTNNKYDNTIRSAAADLLMSNNPLKMDIANIILSLPQEDSNELANFLVAVIKDRIKTGHRSRKILQSVLQNMKFGNYWNLAQFGMASSFTGKLFNSEDSFATYGLSMQYSKAGMMRRTGSDFVLNAQNESIAVTELGIVVQGLEGLTGSEPDMGEEELDSMVGLASVMMGVKLRPITFFRGYGDMMSKIWSGSSDPAGVEAMLMLMDHFEHIPLASGLRVKAEVMGAISTKITADISFSLWSRNVEIVTTNGGAISIQCRLSLESPFVRASVRHSAEGQGAINFSVYTDFSELPPKSCLRMSYPDFAFTKSLRKYERVRGSDRKLLTLFRSKKMNYGLTLPLHSENSIMCAKIMKDS